jgi:anti-sigma factor (TIGR02949 family)
MNNLKYSSMDSCARYSHSIAVYVDGELDPGHAVDVEAHVLTCSSCAERVAMLQTLRQSLKRTSARRCPDALRARLCARIEKERKQASDSAEADTLGPKLIRLRYAVGLAAAAGVVFAMGVSKYTHPRDDVAAQPERTEFRSASIDILDELVSLHANPLPPETTNPEELTRWDPLVGVPVRRPPFLPLGASFHGARVHASAERRAALLQYTLRGHRVTVYVFNPRVVPVKAMPLEPRVVHERPVYVGHLRGYSVAAAEQSGVGYALASDLGADQSTALVLTAIQQ